MPINILGGNSNLSDSKQAIWHGMVGGEKKNKLINQSSCLIFPVKWNEPFGIAMIEAMYFGCPVLGSPYGSLPEIVKPEVGFLSYEYEELIEHYYCLNRYSREYIHQYVIDNFHYREMTQKYINIYERVISGVNINKRQPELIPNTNSDLPIFEKEESYA